MISSAHKTDILYHTGQRTLKMAGDASTVDLNAQLQQIVSGLNRVTIYPSPYLVLTEQGYTKHYYAGADRVCARLGSGGLDHDTSCISRNEEVSTRVENLFWHGLKLVDAKEFKPEIIKELQLVDANGKELDWLKNVDIEKLLMRLRISVKPDPWSIHKIIDDLVRERPDEEPDVYYYHSDHLGGASWITDRSGKPVQHLQYLPFGEPFVDQHPAGYQERYTFTGKERDEETGYHYFGARYYWSSVLTGWLSVDPMADKYPNISPYNYCMWNPVKLVDYNGEEPVKPLIKYYGGGHFMVNTANLSKSTQSRIAIANYYGAHDEKNIGVNLTIGYYNTPHLKPDNTPYFIPQDGIGVDPEHVIKVKTPEGRLKRNGKPYYNTYGWTSCAKGPGVGRATGLTFLAIDITVNVENTRQLNEVLNDNRELRRQIGLLNEASSMVNTAIKSGIVFNESQASNNDFLGDVINYIYQGTYVSHGGTVSGRRISPEAIKKAKEIMSNNNLKYPLISYPQ